jgi:hypothetical protein
MRKAEKALKRMKAQVKASLNLLEQNLKPLIANNNKAIHKRTSCLLAIQLREIKAETKKEFHLICFQMKSGELVFPGGKVSVETETELAAALRNCQSSFFNLPHDHPVRKLGRLEQVK